MENGLVMAIILMALFIFGALYDRFVAWVENQGQHGYTAVLVILGTLVTLGGMGLADLVVDWNAFLLGLTCFACSGSPMAGGSILRHVLRQAKERRQAQELAREALSDDAA